MYAGPTARRIRSRWRKTTCAATAAIIALALTAALAPSAGADFVGSGSHPWAIVLCNFNNETVDAGNASYWRQFFTNAGAGSGGYNWVDYWHDVSFGQLDVSGTQVITGSHADANGWYTIPESRDTWETKQRWQKVVDCANAASSDVDYSKYYGVLTIFPEGRGNLTAPLTATSTTMTLNASPTSPAPTSISTNYFPTPPFTMSIEKEKVTVTSISGNTFTITRGVAGTTAAAHASGVGAGVPGDFGEARSPTPVGTPPGQFVVTLNSGTFQLGLVVLPNEADVAGAAHETGHAFGYNHTRKLSNSTNDYGDFTDIMSAYATANLGGLGTPFGGSALGGAVGDKGPGLTSMDLDKQGWIPSAKHFLFNNSAAPSATVTLHSLSDPGALSAGGYLEARIPAPNTTIENGSPLNAAGSANVAPTNPPTCSGSGYSCTSSVYYTAEYRQAQGWDGGLRTNSVVLHLLGADGRPYWVDKTPLASGGLLHAGGEYVDPGNNTYIAVNSIDPGSQSATVTMRGTPITPTLTLGGATSGDYDDGATITGALTVNGAPVPNQSVTITLGSQTCTQTTDLSGNVSCNITPSDAPGAYTAGGSFAGDSAYTSATATQPFTITREESAVSFTGPASVANGAPATLTATITEDGSTGLSGKSVTLTLNPGASQQSCTGTSDSSGNVSCTISNVAQPASATTLPVSVSFPGDTYYLPSSDNTGSVGLRYYTGRAYALSTGLFGLAPGVFSDTGPVLTAGASSTSQSLVSLSIPFINGSVLGSNVTTGIAGSTSQASVAGLGIGVPLLPVISLGTVTATSTSTCSGATGTTTISSLVVGGIPLTVGIPAPNTTINLGLLKIVLNEQIPVAGADHGLTVNAVHITSPGLMDVVVSSAESDIHNC